MRVVDVCYGPEGGRCSRAGYRINPEDASPKDSRLWLPRGAGQCPLAWNLEMMG